MQIFIELKYASEIIALIFNGNFEKNEIYEN